MCKNEIIRRVELGVAGEAFLDQRRVLVRPPVLELAVAPSTAGRIALGILHADLHVGWRPGDERLRGGKNRVVPW